MEDSGMNAASDVIEEGAEGAVGGSDVDSSVFEYGDSSKSLPIDELEAIDSSVLKGVIDLKISPDPENLEEMDNEDVSKE